VTGCRSDHGHRADAGRNAVDSECAAIERGDAPMTTNARTVPADRDRFGWDVGLLFVLFSGQSSEIVRGRPMFDAHYAGVHTGPPRHLAGWSRRRPGAGLACERSYRA
jgi:hypothetical protein